MLYCNCSRCGREERVLVIRPDYLCPVCRDEDRAEAELGRKVDSAIAASDEAAMREEG